MKVTQIAFTDYPIEFDLGVEGAQRVVPVTRIFVEKYDGNKYCHVHIIDQAGKRLSETCWVKLGYIFMDVTMKRRPNRTTQYRWEGIQRVPKKRVRKKFYDIDIVVFENGDETFMPLKDRTFNTIKDVHRAVRSLTRKLGETLVKHVEVNQYTQYGHYNWQHTRSREKLIWSKDILTRMYKGRRIYVRNNDGTYKYA